MNNQLSYYTKSDNFMTEEQFDQVVEAILNGKYSWACVLILRFAGYNPLHYIPYRTYNRILKSTYQNPKNQPDSIELNNLETDHKNAANSDNNVKAIGDLEYLEIVSDSPGETLRERDIEVKGGYQKLPVDLSHWFYLSE